MSLSEEALYGNRNAAYDQAAKKVLSQLKKMCNLSEGVYNSGFNDGVNVGTRNKAKEDLQNLIESTGWSLEKAMQALRIPLEERDHYEKALKKQH
ncbi:hypothetical protein [Mitsuokella jalaludinii]|uniref:hypothetical protein n=1 Tax=Mitsuokella jalaludinii TaxID=187979 RepID=UPI0022E35CB2|nr:hypothetical protein [Mitsuokella jalaludinii]